MSGEKRGAAILDHWGDHPAWDYAPLVLLVGAHVTVVLIGKDGADVLGAMSSGQRTMLYGLLASITGIIFGFATASISLFYAASHERLQAIRDEGGPKIRQNFMAVLRTLLVTIGLLVAAIVLEGGGAGAVAVQWGRWVAEAAAILMAVRLLRLVWLFGEMLGVLSQRSGRGQGSGLPVHSEGASLTRQSGPAA